MADHLVFSLSTLLMIIVNNFECRTSL